MVCPCTDNYSILTNHASTAAFAGSHVARALTYTATPPVLSLKPSIPGSIIPSFSGRLIQDKAFMTTPTQVSTVVVEASMVSEQPPPAFTPADLDNAVVDTALPNDHNNDTAICPDGYGYYLVT